MKELKLSVGSGGGMLVFLLLAMVGGVALCATKLVVLVLLGVLVLVAALFALFGLFVVNPNEGRVLQLFGRYVGTTREEGLRWANPLMSKRKVSLRVRSFETAKIKVNDIEGNPIEIGAIVVWRVTDTAEASFVVDDFVQFVHVQAESAVRNLATRHPYDAHDDQHMSLRGHTDAIAKQLQAEIQERVAGAGVEITEARIAHLAYAPEIAQAMLQRQQAGAIIAARTRIVEGAVSMVQMALDRLAKDNIVELDTDPKAAMAPNPPVGLCGEPGPQPVVNTGTIHQ